MKPDLLARLANLDREHLEAVLASRAEPSAAELDEEQVDRSLDGACTNDPRPAILVNLLEPERFPWRTRITLAHELCHLLFDQETPGRSALVSPHGEVNLFPGFTNIERRARAFAACFLAPAEGVRAAGTKRPR